MRRAPAREEGMALLSVLVLVAVMGVVVVIALEALTRSVRVSQAAAGRSQAAWYVHAVEVLAVSALTDHVALQAASGGGELVQAIPISLAVPGGRIEATLRDASNCLNLNGVVTAGETGGYEADPAASARFVHLLTLAGLDPTQAVSLKDALADWIDSDSVPAPLGFEDGYYLSRDPAYRTGGTLLSEMSELRAIEGFTPVVLEQVARFTCVRPLAGQAPLNVNVLTPDQAILLASVFSMELTPEAALAVIGHRPVSGWVDARDFLAQEEISGIRPDLRLEDAISVQSRYFELEGSVSLTAGTVAFQVLLGVSDTGRAEVLFTRLGET